MRYVRITCLPVNAPDQRPITVDAVLDDAQRIMGRYPLFGIWANLEHEADSYNPLVLRADGVLDYGDAFHAESDRYCDFDLREGPIQVNRLLSYKSRDRRIVVSYLIDKIVDLPGAA